jgi:hypothetical protein
MKVVGHMSFRFLLPVLLVAFAFQASGQATMTTTGNWNTAGNWSGSNIGDLVTEDVTINTGINATLPTALSYTIGTLNLVQDNTLTLQGTNVATSINVGDAGNSKNMTVGNNTNIVVEAGTTLEIWGSFAASGNLTMDVYGTLYIHGAAAFSNVNTNVTVRNTGSLIIGGSFASGQNTNFQVDGYVEVFGALAVGSGSNLNGSGTFKLHGGCAGPWCSNPMLPVDLLYFKTRNSTTDTELVWATASEIDTDYFTVEKSLDGKSFYEITRIISTGSATEGHIYSFVDEKPAAGTSYYRLNEIGRGGIKKNLSTIRNSFDSKRSVDISPNPSVRDQPLSFSLNFSSEEAHEISVFDVRGVLMGKGVMNGAEATLPLQLGAGVYIVRVASSEFVSVQRIVVQ